MAAADQVDGATDEQAKMVAIRAIAARLHGFGIGASGSAARVHRPRSTDAGAAYDSPVRVPNEPTWGRRLNVFGNTFPLRCAVWRNPMGPIWRNTWPGWPRRPQTLIHGDFRLDNMFFDPDELGDVAVVDWQVSGWAAACKMSRTSCPPALPRRFRRNIEREAIETYTDIVRSVTSGGFMLDECWRSYREAMLTCLRVPIIAGGQLDLSSERSRQLGAVFLQRTLTAIDDLDAGEFLPADSEPAN